MQHVTQLLDFLRKLGQRRGYYETLKYCTISKSDIANYQKTFSKEQFGTLLFIASLNSSGYIREVAVKKLSDSSDEKSIQFIIYRLADWVQVIRETALKGLENFKKPEFINAIIDNLSVFEWLQKVERTNLDGLYNDILNYVVVENKRYVFNNFKTFSDKTRLIIAKQISSSKDVEWNELKLLLEDNHFIIRNLALSHFEKLAQTDIDKLLIDNSPRIRLQVLYKLKYKNNFQEILFPFLYDNSASVREFARYILRTSISDFGFIYNENLKSNKNIIGSLCGLGETSGKQYTANIEKYLLSNKVKIRKTAFLALKKLDTEKAYNFALQNLNSEFAGIRNVVVNFLSSSVTPAVLLKARETYNSGTLEQKKSMLKLFSKIGKWTTIADIMIGTIDEDERVRNLSLAYLRQWKIQATSFFTQPESGEIERANQIFAFAFEMHEEKKYFRGNPLIGIDFYLR